MMITLSVPNCRIRFLRSLLGILNNLGYVFINQKYIDGEFSCSLIEVGELDPVTRQVMLDACRTAVRSLMGDDFELHTSK